MNSKQSTKSQSITVSDVYNLISQQILIGKMSAASLKLQAEHSTLLKSAQDHTISIINKKLELIEALNSLREEQLKEFDEFKQNECNFIVEDINRLDEPTDEYIAIFKQLEAKRSELQQLIEKINALQQSLPDEKILDFYKVKPKLSIQSNCSAEISHMD